MKMFSVQVPLTLIELGPPLLVIALRAAVILEYAFGPPFGQMTVRSAAIADPVAKRIATASVRMNGAEACTDLTKVVMFASLRRISDIFEADGNLRALTPPQKAWGCPEKRPEYSFLHNESSPPLTYPRLLLL